MAAVTCVAVVSACGGPQAAPKTKGTVVGSVAGQPLYVEAIELIAQRDGVDEQTAKARAVETLRLVAMRTEASPDAKLDPVRSQQLRGTALARAYLDTVFEPEASPEGMDKDYVDRILNDSSLVARHFHPRLHFVCQVIVRPKPAQGSTELPRIPEGDASWRTDAEAFGATFWRHASERAPDLKTERSCEQYQRLWALHERDSADGRFNLHFESMAYDVTRSDIFDAGFVQAMTPINEPGLVPPFYTVFGYHMVFVPKILESTLVVAPEASDEERRSARAKKLTELLLTQWRAEVAFPRMVGRLGEKHVVRLASQAEGTR